MGAKPSIQITLSPAVYDRLMARVETLDTTVQDWVATTIIEALEKPDALRTMSPAGWDSSGHYGFTSE
ncbi:MAG TPA: hypothetical protein VHL09_02485 [Dehalococcoidia bacterium]|nr:hypothetical protein [Dehalococcoidia bacterium]